VGGSFFPVAYALLLSFTASGLSVPGGCPHGGRWRLGGVLKVGSALQSRDALTRVLSPHSSVTKREKVLVYLLVYQVS